MDAPVGCRGRANGSQARRPPLAECCPRLLFAAMPLMPGETDGATIDNISRDCEALPFADLRTFHAQGYCKGQIVLLSETRGLPFTAESSMNLDTDGALGSLQHISELDFNVA